MNLAASIAQFWNVMLRGIMNLTGWNNTKAAKAALVASIGFNVVGSAHFHPISIGMLVASIFWLSKCINDIERGLDAGSDSIRISEKSASWISELAPRTTVIAGGEFIFYLIVKDYWSEGIPAILGSLSFSATCHFMLDFESPRKSWSRRAIDWVKSRNWSLGGRHLPTPTPI